jgi:hypothetical protein
MDQRKKGIKPPFFRNNPQGNPTSREPRTIKTGGQRPRQPPIQCWGCKGDHMFRYCSHRSDKARVVHNVQKVEKVGDMEKNVPRIHAALNNKKIEYQSHMIEVECMIHNRTIIVLIDSGSSHSYVDPEMVESLQFPIREHGKYFTMYKKLKKWGKWKKMYQGSMQS